MRTCAYKNILLGEPSSLSPTFYLSCENPDYQVREAQKLSLNNENSTHLHKRHVLCLAVPVYPSCSSVPRASTRFQVFYLSSLFLMLYFSRNSACFCLRISVCFLKPFTLRDKRNRHHFQYTVSSTVWARDTYNRVGLRKE